jgi:hypothetical protein
VSSRGWQANTRPLPHPKKDLIITDPQREPIDLSKSIEQILHLIQAKTGEEDQNLEKNKNDNNKQSIMCTLN